MLAKSFEGKMLMPTTATNQLDAITAAMRAVGDF
jgi:hypothetical protein